MKGTFHSKLLEYLRLLDRYEIFHHPLDIHNHFHNNTNGEVDGTSLQTANTSGDPNFVDDAGGNFALGALSDARNVEIGTHFQGTGTFMDIGALQQRQSVVRLVSGMLARGAI